MLTFDSRNLFWNIHYKRAYMAQTSPLWRSWKKTPTAFRLFVSKFMLFPFWSAAAQLKDRVTVCWGSFITHSLAQTHSQGLLPTIKNFESGAATCTSNNKTTDQYPCFYRCPNPRYQERNLCRPHSQRVWRCLITFCHCFRADVLT